MERVARWIKPTVLATFSEDEILAQQHDLEAEAWGLWSNGSPGIDP